MGSNIRAFPLYQMDISNLLRPCVSSQESQAALLGGRGGGADVLGRYCGIYLCTHLTSKPLQFNFTFTDNPDPAK